MLNRIHQRLGTAGFVISIVALVAALTGGAYAAGGLTKSQEKQVTKIAQKEAKKFAGKNGSPGATGPAGPAGAAGAKGDTGTKGDTGAEGKQGPEGKQGKEGSPWTAGGVLPSGVTVTGTWTSTAAGAFGNSPVANISFPLPAKEGKQFSAWAFTETQILHEEFGEEEFGPEFFVACKVGVAKPECKDSGCKGPVLSPSAPAGTLCVYVSTEFTSIEGALNPENLIVGSAGNFGTAGSYGTFGAGIFPQAPALESSSHYDAYGTWALKAP